ncbi:uncharacterized protein PAC_19487 [Phialocephala subalpina]|uniref:Uncharacterized protein n=1 Tax=Phialocephala subalpina TaxID=576137 RepID=A0A1L7XX52_9HELO|nr:uncharacterized protein PAC_19487 [Phialocephala subalpina]
MTSQPSKAKALLLPADGSGVRLVSYNIKERDDNDMVDNGLAEFYDPIPDLKTWLDGGYQQRAIASFHVDIKENNNTDPIARAYFPSQDLAAFGQYCLYYTVSSTLPLNETCRRILDIVPPPNRLFWRGDVVVVRYEGHLGMGHVYTDVKEALLGPVEAVLKKVYDCKGLEGVHEEGFSLREEMSKLQARFPALMQAIDTGSLEKLRTNQPLNDIDLRVIHQIPRMIARFPDGSEETIWEPPLKDLARK